MTMSTTRSPAPERRNGLKIRVQPVRLRPWAQSKVDRSGGPLACWPWQSADVPPGACRAALESRLGRRLASRERPARVCTSPTCCNPAHLIPTEGRTPARAVRR